LFNSANSLLSFTGRGKTGHKKDSPSVILFREKNKIFKNFIVKVGEAGISPGFYRRVK
jgi:hypothetical protein